MRTFSLAFGLLLASSPPRAEVQTPLTVGSGVASYVAGAEYFSFRSDTVILRYEAFLYPLAARLFPQLQNHVEKLQRELKFKLKRPIPVYLTSRGFGNAFVMYPSTASSAFSVIPSQLTSAELGSPIFIYAGMDEGFFDVFTHELMHYIEVDQRQEPWAQIVGDAAFRAPDPSPWMAEAWAVVHESQEEPFKGRAKDSYHGALVRSGVSERSSQAPEPWDLSSSNPEWKPVGSHYVVGSMFYRFLKERYGFGKLNDLVIHQNQWGGASAYEAVYGKTFATLFAEFQAETRRAVESTPSTGGEVIFDRRVGAIGALGTTPDGDLVFLGRSPDQTPRLYHLNKDGGLLRERGFFEWLAPFVRRPSPAPIEWSSGSGKQKLFYFSAEANLDGNAEIPGLYAYDLNNATVELVKALPLTRTAWVARDGDTYYAVRQPSLLKEQFVLEQGSVQNRFAPQSLAQWNDFAGLSQLRLSEDEKQFSFTAIRTGGTWGIYSSDAESAYAPKLVLDSRGQDLFAQVTDRGVFFLSDLNGRSFQVYQWSKGCLRQLSREPYFVRSFVVGPQGQVWAISRLGQRERIVRVTDANTSACVEPKAYKAETAAVASELPPTKQRPVKEAAVDGFAPSTHTLLPRYVKGTGFGLQALVAGESPYKAWGWTALADFDFEDPSGYLAGFGMNFLDGYPYVVKFNLESSRYAVGSVYAEDARFLSVSFDLSRSFGNHRISARALPSFETSDQGYGSAFGLGVFHSFSNTQGTHRSSVPQKGWILATGLEQFPSFFGSRTARTVVRADQDFYLPVLADILPSHSLRVAFQELRVSTGTAYLTGTGGKRTFFRADSELSTSTGIPLYASQGLSLRGYSDTQLAGNFAAKSTIEYAIPLSFLQHGASNLLGRRWLNPETTTFLVKLFYDTAYITGLDPAEYSRANRSLSSTGVQAQWVLWINDSRQSGVWSTYVMAKELQEQKRLEHNVQVSAAITY